MMKERLLEWIACPTCGGDLSLGARERDGDEIVEGTLDCPGCPARYPVTRSIPRLLPRTLAPDVAATVERFGYEWSRFAEIRPEYEAQFRGWIAPVPVESFAGRMVLDAGCGKGRHLRLVAAFGACEVVGIDLGSAVDVAARNTADLPNVHIVQGDLARPPFRRSLFDIVYSIGVLHHLPEPSSGFRSLAPLLVPDGTLIAWVYAREGNGWVLASINPLRRITHRLPLPIVRGLAWALTVPVWVMLRMLYKPARRHAVLRSMLPYQSYLSDVTAFPFREVHSIAFDQLLPPLAHYISRSDVERCFSDAGLTIRTIRWHHENSWAASGNPRVTPRDRCAATGSATSVLPAS
jgi:SAM-dependent methyltransferase